MGRARNRRKAVKGFKLIAKGKHLVTSSARASKGKKKMIHKKISKKAKKVVRAAKRGKI